MAMYYYYFVCPYAYQPYVSTSPINWITASYILTRYGSWGICFTCGTWFSVKGLICSPWKGIFIVFGRPVIFCCPNNLLPVVGERVISPVRIRFKSVEFYLNIWWLSSPTFIITSISKMRVLLLFSLVQIFRDMHIIMDRFFIKKFLVKCFGIYMEVMKF